MWKSRIFVMENRSFSGRSESKIHLIPGIQNSMTKWSEKRNKFACVSSIFGMKIIRQRDQQFVRRFIHKMWSFFGNQQKKWCRRDSNRPPLTQNTSTLPTELIRLVRAKTKTYEIPGIKIQWPNSHKSAMNLLTYHQFTESRLFVDKISNL